MRTLPRVVIRTTSIGHQDYIHWGGFGKIKIQEIKIRLETTSIRRGAQVLDRHPISIRPTVMLTIMPQTFMVFAALGAGMWMCLSSCLGGACTHENWD